MLSFYHLAGFPIYGPLSGGVNITTADLDDCNGQMRDGSYEYRMTYDFPYVLGCFAGLKNLVLLGQFMATIKLIDTVTPF